MRGENRNLLSSPLWGGAGEVNRRRSSLSFRVEQSESPEPMNTTLVGLRDRNSPVLSPALIVFMGSGLGFAAPE